MAKTSKAVILPIELTASESTVETLRDKLKCGDEGIVRALSQLMSSYLAAYSQGAFVITDSDIERMSKSTGIRVNSANKVVELVEVSVGRQAGAYEFKVAADPSMIESMNDMAKVRSMTLDQVIQEAWDTIVMSGWLWQVPSYCTTFIVNESEKQELMGWLGKTTFTGKDVVDFIREKVG
jgi:hypothetical protein